MIYFIYFFLLIIFYELRYIQLKEDINEDYLKFITGQLNETVLLKCDNSKTIHILDASYGNPKIDNFLIKKDSLDAPHTIPIVQMLCEGKNNCNITINNETFKILNMIKDFHKFIVKYSCLSQTIKPYPEFDVTAKRSPQKIWSIEFASKKENDLKSYLHVNNINATCDEVLQKQNYVDVNEAIQECDNLEICVFIIFNNDGYTLCKSSYYKNAVIESGSMIYIKMSYIAGNIPSNFEVIPNIQGVCEKEEIIHQMDNVLKLYDTYQNCEKVNCDYFTMSTANGVKGASKSFRNYVWFCKGNPKYVSHDGFIFGIKKSLKNPKKFMTYKNFEGPLS